jgi:hypothetical protein
MAKPFTLVKGTSLGAVGQLSLRNQFFSKAAFPTFLCNSGRGGTDETSS